MTLPDSREPGGNERGMILINVLVIVMLAAAVLAIMLAGEDADLERSTRLRQGAQAMAIARGAELSAVAALRRDLASGSTTDSRDEAWAHIADQDVAIEGGRFSFGVSDAQALFNLNGLTRGDALTRATFQDIAIAAGIDLALAERFAAEAPTGGPIDDLALLGKLGVGPDDLRRIARFCTVLPGATTVNLNTAPERVIAALFRNPEIARKIVTLQARRGGITYSDITAAGIVLPPGTGLSSQYFWARSKVRIGETGQQLTSLLTRRIAQGKPEVVAIRRWRGRPPLQAPELDKVP